MTGTKNRLTVRLNGGKPWGFRLQGGAGTGLPLTVSKVRRKSKAYKNLFEGDIIMTVNGRPCENLTYDQVMEVVDGSAMELNIEIIREGSNKENVAPMSRPAAAPTVEKAEKFVTTSNFEAPSSENIVRKETVTLTESTTKLTEKSEGFRIKSISCQPETSLSVIQNEDIPLTNQSSTKSRSSIPEKSVGMTTSSGPSDTSVSSLTQTCSPFDTSTKSVSKEVTSDDRKFEKTTTESMHEKHGNTETTFVKTEHESVIQEGDGKLDSNIPSLANGRLSNLSSEHGESTLEESRTSSCKSVEKTTKETLSTFLSETEKEVTNILTTLGLKSPFETTNDSVSTTSTDEMKTTSENLGPVKKVPPPPPPKPKIRPFSDPCVDRYLDHVDEDLPLNTTDVHSTVTTSTDTLFAPFEFPFGSIAVTKKKKMFSSSSFYEEPHAIYPTVEEQVEMAKKIADSLADDTNKKSKGANMFYKRVKKSTKWVHEGPEPSDESESGTPEIIGESDPWKSAKTIVPLKLVLDPRHTEDVKSLMSSGHIISEHNVVSPDVCHGLVRDLESPVGKGAALFAKRKKKSSEWIVDEEKVRSHMREYAPVPTTPTPVFSSLSSSVPGQRVKLLKTPWDAALESPIGSCDAAFVEVSRGLLADSVIHAAVNKRRDSLPTSPPQEMETCRSPSVPMSPAAAYYDIYKPKAPRGWTGSPFSQESSSRYSLPDRPLSTLTETMVEPRQTASLPHKMVFQNFNTVPRKWKAPVN